MVLGGLPGITYGHVLKRHGEKQDRGQDHQRQDERFHVEDRRERHKRSYESVGEALEQARRFAVACLTRTEPLEDTQREFDAQGIGEELYFWCHSAKASWQHGAADPLCQLYYDVVLLATARTLFVLNRSQRGSNRHDMAVPSLTQSQREAANRILRTRLEAQREVDRQYHACEHVEAETVEAETVEVEHATPRKKRRKISPSMTGDWRSRMQKRRESRKRKKRERAGDSG